MFSKLHPYDWLQRSDVTYSSQVQPQPRIKVYVWWSKHTYLRRTDPFLRNDILYILLTNNTEDKRLAPGQHPTQSFPSIFGIDSSFIGSSSWRNIRFVVATFLHLVLSRPSPHNHNELLKLSPAHIRSALFYRNSQEVFQISPTADWLNVQDNAQEWWMSEIVYDVVV